MHLIRKWSPGMTDRGGEWSEEEGSGNQLVHLGANLPTNAPKTSRLLRDARRGDTGSATCWKRIAAAARRELVERPCACNLGIFPHLETENQEARESLAPTLPPSLPYPPRERKKKKEKEKKTCGAALRCPRLCDLTAAQVRSAKEIKIIMK